MNIEIANRLVELRRGAGLSQEDLAAQLGVSRQAVSKWERAESSPDTDNLIALARLYGVSLDAMLFHASPSAGGAAAQAAYAAPEAEAAYEAADEADEEYEIFAAAQAWDRAQEKEQAKAAAKRKDKLLWLLTLALMVLLPVGSALLGLGAAYAMVVVIVYLALGFLLDNWHPGWMLFLSIPLYYMISERVLGFFF